MALDAPSKTGSQAGRLAGADGLRALAAGAVLLHHGFLMLRAPDGGLAQVPWPAATGFMDLRWGLTLFFVLSGFLLFRPFAAAILRDSEAPDVRRYLRNRALRILPAYWVVLLVTGLVLGSAIVRWPSESGYLTDPALLLANLALLQGYSPDSIVTGIGPAWSLAVEAVFYLALPVLALLAARALASGRGPRNRIVAACAPAVVLLALGVAAKLALGALVLAGLSPGWHNVAKLSFPVSADLFAPGMLAAVVHVLVADGRLAFTRGRRRALLAVAAGCLLLAAVAVGRTGPTHGELPDTLMAFSFGAAVLLLLPAARAARPSLATRVLEWRPLLACGLASYSVYLWHTPVLLTMHRAGLRVDGAVDLAGGVLLCAVVTGGLSWLTYRFVEVPALARRRPAEQAATRRRLEPLPE